MSQPTAKDLIAEASEQRKRELYEPVLVRLFQTYDEDESGTLEANEIRQIMLDCIEDERKVLNEKEVSQLTCQEKVGIGKKKSEMLYLVLNCK